MSIENVDPDDAIDAVLKDSVRITPDKATEVRRLVMHVDEPAFRVTPGQQIGVVVKGDSAFGGKPHVRRYSVTDVEPSGDGVDISMLVRRCHYTDEISGELYPGVASNFLCDVQKGQPIALIGPYRNPFKIPVDTNANLLLIGSRTGIAPFRPLIQSIYREGIEWKGNVRLFFGARNGMEMLYLNDQDNDLAQYYDEETFKAFKSMDLRPLADERDALREAIESNVDVAWDLMNQSNTHVYLAGLRKQASVTDEIFTRKAGGAEAWEQLKSRLTEEKRWSTLLYE